MLHTCIHKLLEGCGGSFLIDGGHRSRSKVKDEREKGNDGTKLKSFLSLVTLSL